MPRQVFFAMAVEAVLILLTTFMLTQPGLIFGARSERTRSLLTMCGLIFLCVTFCWSVVLGCTLTVNSMTIRI